MRFQSQISQLFGDTVLEWCSFCWKRYNTIREILSFSLSLSPTCFHLFFRFVFVSFVYLCEWKSMSYWQSAACTLTKAICLILQIKSLLSFSLLYIWMGIDLCSETQFIVSGINAHQNDKWEKYVISRWHLFGVYIYIFWMSVAQASCVIAAIRIGEKKRRHTRAKWWCCCWNVAAKMDERWACEWEWKWSVETKMILYLLFHPFNCVDFDKWHIASQFSWYTTHVRHFSRSLSHFDFEIENVP